jgi:tetratricopeptide (TPR) repeat protein
MRRTLAIICLLAGLAAAPLQIHAQGIDPAQENFVTAFLAFRKGEELESGNDLRGALKSLRAAADALSRSKQQWPNWQTDMVEFRLKRTNDAINRIQGKIGDSPEPAPAPAPGEAPGEVLPPLPPDTALTSEPGIPVKPVTVKGPRIPKLPPGTDPLTAVQHQITTLQSQLDEQEKNAALVADLAAADKAKKAAEIERKKAADLAEVYQKNLLDIKGRGDQDSSKVKELETQLAEAKKRNESTGADLAAAEERINQLLERSRTVAARAAEAGTLPTKIKQLEIKLADEQSAKKELSERLAAATTERDAARTEIARLKDANKKVDQLLTDNANLLRKLGDAERQIMTFRTEGPKKDEQIAMLQKQVTDTARALTVSQEKNSFLQNEIGELKKKTDDYARQVAQFKTDKAGSAEEKRKMEEENRLLQGIVMRVLQEDANRSQRKKMVQGEIERLHIQSDVLLKQIDYLTQPVVKLRPEERRLFKKPQIEVQDPNTLVIIKPEPAAPAEAPAAVTPEAPAAATPTAAANPPAATPPAEPAPAPTAPAPAAKPPIEIAKADTKPDGLPMKAPVEPGPSDLPPPPSGKPSPGSTRGLPEDVKPLAEQAKQAFDRDDYPEAEKLYDKALQLAPNNLYLLSNKGVVQFRAGKFKQSEETFRKAIAIAPEDHFSWCTLGIVEYSQNQFDDAVNALTKSLAINPKNATAHNYLGITAAQKGWFEAAQKELDTALQLDAKYADAWFNLAVIHTLRTPANKEEARRCYKKAIELGAERDKTMEDSLKE